MTVAVGVVQGAPESGVWLAADTMATRGPFVDYDTNKVTLCAEGRVALAISGYLQGQTIAERAIETALTCGANERLSLSVLVRMIRDGYAAVDWTPSREDGAPAYWDQVYLITDGWRIWLIECHLEARLRGRYDAIGSGGEVALGALHVLVGGSENVLDPEHAVQAAIEAANAHSRYCGGGVTKVFVPRPEKELIVP